MNGQRGCRRVAVAVLVLAAAGVAGADVAGVASADAAGATSAGVVGVVSADAAGGGGGADSAPWVPTDIVDAPRDSVLIDVAVEPDGSAVVRVEIRTRLDSDADRAAFEETARRIREDRLAVAGAFAERMRSTARLAAADRGREMTIRNVTVSVARVEVPRQRGVVVFRFRWDGFARVAPGGRITAGPSLSAIPLGENATLKLRWPGDYERASTSPDPDEAGAGEVSWTGPAEFGADQPRVVLRPAGGIRPTRGLPGWLPAVAGLATLLLVVGLLRRVRGTDRGGVAATPADAEETSGAESTGGTDESAAASPPSELLSDRERVLRLIEENGGRMKQQDVVEAMEWSETKTSDVVAELREAEELEVYRIGRENVLALPGEMDV